ncbi:MAG: hypothetical protein LBG67_05605 [Campylobacteraceae bacterium]|nr:hypothetical protein [Campylobacteraceae bacterium]
MKKLLCLAIVGLIFNGCAISDGLTYIRVQKSCINYSNTPYDCQAVSDAYRTGKYDAYNVPISNEMAFNYAVRACLQGLSESCDTSKKIFVDIETAEYANTTKTFIKEFEGLKWGDSVKELDENAKIALL